MTDTAAASTPRLAWPAALAAATVAGTLATACMMPFVGLAAIAAATLGARRAVATVAAIWLANQLLGFTLLGYPHTADTYLWGGALLVASLAALATAQRVGGGRGMAVGRLLMAFAAAFAVYEALLFGVALFAGGLATFTPAIVARIAANDAIWFAGLVVLHLMLTSAAPRVFGRAPALRLAW